MLLFLMNSLYSCTSDFCSSPKRELQLQKAVQKTAEKILKEQTHDLSLTDTGLIEKLREDFKKEFAEPFNAYKGTPNAKISKRKQPEINKLSKSLIEVGVRKSDEITSHLL